jgi:molybdopterin-guanine dinucleotide biosynthesis protein A
VTDPASAIVLAGGASRRLGEDKRNIRFDSTRTLLNQTIEAVATLSDDVVVVGSTLSLTSTSAVARVIADEAPGHGPLGGLVVGLRAARHARALVVACDLPFLSTSALQKMLELPFDYDLLVPRRADGTIEMLHAVYGATCGDVAARQLDARTLKLAALATVLSNEQRHVRYLDEAFFRPVDPDLATFFNVNTPADLFAARLRAEARRAETP